jgi:hypothetical protein
MPVIGFLHPGSPDSYPHVIAAMHKSLSETGHVEGQNVAIEYRWAQSLVAMRAKKLSSAPLGRLCRRNLSQR